MSDENEYNFKCNVCNTLISVPKNYRGDYQCSYCRTLFVISSLPHNAESIVATIKYFNLNKEIEGKYMAGVLEDMLPALKEIAKLSSDNNKPNGKYDRGSWLNVPNAEVEYLDAFWRHVLEGRHNIDPTTGKPHDIAIAWNAIVLVHFRLKREGKI